MTVIHDLAELESAIADAELTEEETELARGLVAEGMPIPEAIAATLAERGSSDDDPEPDLSAGDELGEPSAKQLRDLERETDRHLEKVRTIMGAHIAGFEPCDHCGAIGLTPPGPRPREHEFFKACETCDGFGQVKTGSLRAGNEARDCPQCKGRGYLEALDAQGRPLADGPSPAPFVPAPIVPAEPQPQPAAGHEATGDVTFGTPAWMGDPNLGR